MPKKKITDKQLLKIVAGFRDGMLDRKSSMGHCFIVSSALQGYLSWACGIESELYEGEWGEGNHVWLVLVDGRVLDATIDQFNYITPKYPKIHLGSPLDAHESGKPIQSKVA